MKTSRQPANLSGWISNVYDVVTGKPRFDTLTTTAKDLQRELSTGNLTSVDIVKEYYRSIFSYNGYLNAIYELAPGALEQAEKLDKMRGQGQLLGQLHDIPVLIKDNIDTAPDLKMGTRAGGLALVDSIPKISASIVDMTDLLMAHKIWCNHLGKVYDAGILIFQVNMGKKSYEIWTLKLYRGQNIRCGWSALAGQCNNPYVRGGDDPTDGLGGHSSVGGSSSGSAVAVTAGLAPLAIGTETEGPLVVPSTRAVENNYSRRRNASALTGSDAWKEFTIGTLNPDDWLPPDGLIKPVREATEEIRRETLAAYAKIRGLAKGYHENIDLRSDRDFVFEGENALSALMVADLENDMNCYLSRLEKSDVRSLREIVEWNLQHADEALPSIYPSQSILERAVTENFSAKRVQKLVNHVQTIGVNFDETIDRYGLDSTIAPTDSLLSAFSAALGFPIATLPLAYLQYND